MFKDAWDGKMLKKSLQKRAVFWPQFRPQLSYFAAYSAMDNSQNRVRIATVQTYRMYMTDWNQLLGIQISPSPPRKAPEIVRFRGFFSFFLHFWKFRKNHWPQPWPQLLYTRCVRDFWHKIGACYGNRNGRRCVYGSFQQIGNIALQGSCKAQDNIRQCFIQILAFSLIGTGGIQRNSLMIGWKNCER